jgi:hypothetical protein
MLMDRDRSACRRSTRPRRHALVAQAGIGDCVRNAVVAGQSLTWPDGAAAAKQAEQLREFEIIIRTPFRGSFPQPSSLFLSPSLVMWTSRSEVLFKI